MTWSPTPWTTHYIYSQPNPIHSLPTVMQMNQRGCILWWVLQCWQPLSSKSLSVQWGNSDPHLLNSWCKPMWPHVGRLDLGRHRIWCTPAALPIPSSHEPNLLIPSSQHTPICPPPPPIMLIAVLTYSCVHSLWIGYHRMPLTTGNTGCR